MTQVHRMPRIAAALLALIAPAAIVSGADKPAAPPAPVEAHFWKALPDQAEVIAATFIGGKGNEWLAAGAFQPDGTIVLAGNVAGPVLDLPVPVQVIGADLPAPPNAQPVTAMQKGKNGLEPKLDKEGKPIMEKPSWRHPGTTGFVVRMTPDLKKIISAHRLPWGSGAITSAAAGADGSIYIAGRATDGIAKLGGGVEELAAAAAASEKADARCDHTFVARLTPDAAKAEWVRHSRGASDAPQVSIDAGGSVRYAAQDVRTFDAAGKLLKTVTVTGGVTKTTSVSPVDGSLVVAGEHHSPTGREPWRCPTMNTYRPDGTLHYQLYDWGGPYVGLDNLRLVSDSAVRFVTHDRDGSILLYAWSDGGNSVMTREPFDVRTSVEHKGLGLSLAGAGVLSAAYVIRIEPKDYHVTGWTAWLAMRGPNKPNSTWIDNMAIAGDGSVALTGRSATGLWQTPNKLAEGPPAGDYIAVLRRDLSGVRFCSLIPGTGATEASYDRAAWGIASGTVNGKQRVLFVGSATAEGSESGVTTPTPTVNALQAKFGGGWSDGYAVLLDLSAGEPAPPAAPVPAPSSNSANFEHSAGGKGKKTDKLPPDGTSFQFRPDVPKWVTVDAEFRDRAGKMWPTFLYGKPVDGTAALKGGRLEGAFTVACTSATQPRGDQSRRVLGALYQGETPPALGLKIDSLSAPKTLEVTSTDAKGKSQTKTITYADGAGTLTLAGRSLPVTPRVTYGFGKTQGIYKGPGKYTEPAESVHLNVWLTLKAADLGLKTLPPDEPIDIRIGLSGIAPPAAAPAP